jgi:dCTP deaminase
MYLSDHDLADAVTLKHLIVVPPPSEYDTTSIDLHLDKIESARVWNSKAYENDQKMAGHELQALRMGFDSKPFSDKYTKPVSNERTEPVFRDGDLIYLRPFGFFLWQTAEIVGTPEENPRYICFVDGKSSKARTGLLVHMTAPTIHAGWWGQVTLEISNLGPFTLALKAGDGIAQMIVACLTSFPANRKKAKGVSIGQRSVSGR